MKRVLILLLLAVASGSALAGGGHVHSRVVVGFNFGYPGWYAPYYYPPPAYYYPPAYYPPYAAPATPTTYVERSDVAEEAPAQPPATWYFCREANGYYPYVKQCPGGWMRVPAQPPN
jgi:hypothetical protein